MFPAIEHDQHHRLMMKIEPHSSTSFRTSLIFLFSIAFNIRRAWFLLGLSAFSRAETQLIIRPATEYIMGVPSHEASNALIYTTYAAFLYPTLSNLLSIWEPDDA
jgi:hypothetical protein